MGCSLEERHLPKVDPYYGPIHDFEMGDRRSRNSPGWIARGSTPLSGSTLRMQHSDVDQWCNPEKFKVPSGDLT